MEFIIALVIAITVILIPAAFIWYVNVGGLLAAEQHRQVKAKEAKATRIV